MLRNRKRSLFKITETARGEPPRKAAYSEHSIASHYISKAVYVIAVLVVVRTDFLNALLRFHFFFLFFLLKQTFVQMCLVMSIIHS